MKMHSRSRRCWFGMCYHQTIVVPKGLGFRQVSLKLEQIHTLSSNVDYLLAINFNFISLAFFERSLLVVIPTVQSVINFASGCES